MHEMCNTSYVDNIYYVLHIMYIMSQCPYLYVHVRIYVDSEGYHDLIRFYHCCKLFLEQRLVNGQ